MLLYLVSPALIQDKPAQPPLPVVPSSNGGGGRWQKERRRRGLIQAELKDRPQVSDRTIAKGLGVSHVTVGTARKELESIGQIVQCDRQTKDGRIYPAERQTAKPAPEPEPPPD